MFSGQLRNSTKTLSAETPIVFYADDISYDRDLGVWKAIGHVEFSQEGKVLEADHVLYNQKANLLIARGNVRLRDSKDEVLLAEYVELTGDLKEGILQEVRYMMADKSRLAAVTARRSEGGTKTKFLQSVYSPCYPCEKDKKSPPLWQIKAREVTQDRLKKRITATDVQMDFLQLPVFYTPYLSFPTERSSGFLAPTFTLSTVLGTSIGVPYYWAINDISDLTLTPFVMAKQGALLGATYRHQWRRSKLNLTGSLSGTKPFKPKETEDPSKNIGSIRGHLFAQGHVNFNEKWRLLLDGKYVSNRTYFRSFRELPPFSGIWGSPFLQSDLKVERFSQRDYFSTEGIFYQGLKEGNTSKNTPFLAPLITYHQTTAPLWKGTYLTMDGNLVALNRQEGSQYQRAIMMGSWHFPYITSSGQILNVFGKLRGDFYHTRVTDPMASSQVLFRGNTGRFLPQAGIEGRWPLFNKVTVIEPIVQLIGAPQLKYSSKIPDIDSKGFEFNDANLFEINRFPGFDIIDDGSRLAYGAFFIPQINVLDKTRLFLGQNYGLSKPNPLAQSTGIHKGFSDYVGHLQADPHPWITLDGRIRLSRNRLRAVFSEASAGLGPAITRLGITYTHFSGSSSLKDAPQSTLKQLGITLSSRLSNSWSVSLNQLRGLKESGLLAQGAEVLYENECLNTRIFVGRSYYRYKDIRPGITFMITLGFKNLGSTGYKGSKGASSQLPGSWLGKENSGNVFSPLAPVS